MALFSPKGYVIGNKFRKWLKNDKLQKTEKLYIKVKTKKAKRGLYSPYCFSSLLLKFLRVVPA